MVKTLEVLQLHGFANNVCDGKQYSYLSKDFTMFVIKVETLFLTFCRTETSKQVLR